MPCAFAHTASLSSSGAPSTTITSAGRSVMPARCSSNAIAIAGRLWVGMIRLQSTSVMDLLQNIEQRRQPAADRVTLFAPLSTRTTHCGAQIVVPDQCRQGIMPVGFGPGMHTGHAVLDYEFVNPDRRSDGWQTGGHVLQEFQSALATLKRVISQRHDTDVELPAQMRFVLGAPWDERPLQPGNIELRTRVGYH